jgi:hypothetical protein
MLQPIFLFVALVCSGLGAGSAYTTFFWFKPGVEGTAAWFAELQYAVPRIGVPLFVLQPLALLATLVSAGLAWTDRPSSCFLGLAALAILLAALVTRFGHIPINVRVRAWRVTELPPEAPALQRRWWTLHVVRTVLLLIGFGGIVLGALTRHG